MFFSSQKIRQLDENGIHEFLARGIDEGLHLDYKLEIELNDKGKVEFLKDVSAFANAGGGTMLIGVLEPDPQKTVDDLLVGVDNGFQLTQQLEQLADSSLDPRIPNMHIGRVELDSGRWVVTVHIPPSVIKPHMVDFKKHQKFYLRGTETTSRMRTQEIANIITSNLSREDKIQSSFMEREEDARSYFVNEFSAFIIQAIPQIAPETYWNVHDIKFLESLRSSSLREGLGSYYCSLCTQLMPQIGVNCLTAMDDRDDTTWFTEVSADGQIVAVVLVKPTSTANDIPMIGSNYADLFIAFADLIDSMVHTSTHDSPFVIDCKYVNAKGTRLSLGSSYTAFSSQPYARDIIKWPQALKPHGVSALETCEKMADVMWNAFGKRGPQQRKNS